MCEFCVLFCLFSVVCTFGRPNTQKQPRPRKCNANNNQFVQHAHNKKKYKGEEEEEQKGNNNKQSSSSFARATPAPLAPTTCVHWKEEAKTHTRTHTHTEQYRPPACVPSKGGTTTLPVFTPRLLFLFCPFFFFWYSARTTARATHSPQQASSRLVSLTVPQNTQGRKCEGSKDKHKQTSKQAQNKLQNKPHNSNNQKIRTL